MLLARRRRAISSRAIATISSMAVCMGHVKGAMFLVVHTLMFHPPPPRYVPSKASRQTAMVASVPMAKKAPIR